MTTPGITGSRTAYARHDKIDIDNVLKLLIVDDTHLLGAIGMSGVVKNTEHRWMEDSLNAVYFTGATAGVTSSTTVKVVITTPTSTSTLQNIVRKYGLVSPENAEYQLRFTTTPVVGTNYLAIHGNTTAGFATQSAGTKFMMAALPKRDIDTASGDTSKARITRLTFTQVFERGIQIEKTRENVDLYTVGSELQHQTMLRTKAVKRELGISIINSYAYWDGTRYTDEIENRSMPGFIHQVRDPGLTGTATDATVTNAASAELDADMINALVLKMYELGGFQDESDVCLAMGPRQAQKFSAIATANLRSSKIETKKRGFFADHFISDFAGISMPLLLDRNIPNDKVLFVDKSRANVKPLQGDTWGLEEMAKTGRFRNFQISGQYTVMFDNAGSCHGMIYNLKIT